MTDPMQLTTQDLILIEQRVTNDSKSVGLAYALWFFLGLVSGHRFYLGRAGSAVLQIVSYFLFFGFIWWLVDAFLIPGMVKKDRDELRKKLISEAEAARYRAIEAMRLAGEASNQTVQVAAP
jgi:TM2 domain-containing membrane protein YozV